MIEVLENGNVNLGNTKDEIIENFKNKDYHISFHTDYYMNYIEARLETGYNKYSGCSYESLGFASWADHADCYYNNDKILIRDREHLKEILATMDKMMELDKMIENIQK